MTTTRDGVEPKLWYIGSLNDGLFIIDKPPRPCDGNDHPFHDRTDGPDMVLNVTDLPLHKVQAIVDEHNTQLSAARRESAWQPIATAPRDGSRILCVHAPYSRQFIAHFGSGANVWQDDTGALRDPTHWQWMPHGPIRQIGATSGEGAGV